MNNIKILYEYENILVINKPSGFVVHPYDHSTEYTLVDFLHEHIPESFSIDNKVTLQDKRIIPLGGIVHKLDRDTSGVMVIAKTQTTFDELKEQFRNHTTKKVYIALVEGIIESLSFTIDAPLGRSKKDYKQSTSPDRPRGELRPAVTDVRVISHNNTMTLVELTPKTGRTHQLRAHMASINHPIVGDKAYGSSIDSPRIMLHAKSLDFVLQGENKHFEIEAPKDFIS